MQTRLIQLTYRKIIDAAAPGPWDKLVWESTWSEYQLQVQNYDKEKQFPLFSELLQQVPAAVKLHFLVSASVTGYLRQLNGKVPDILNSLGLRFLPFNQYQFELIESDIRDKKQHRVAVRFVSDPLYWIDTVGNRLLLANAAPQENAGWMTEMLELSPFVSISSLKTLQDDQTISR